MEWVRRWIRRRTRPIPRHKARLFHDRLSVVYYMLAWTAAGFAFFKILSEDPTALPVELDIHADPNAKLKPSIYKSIEMVRKPSDDVEIKIFNVRNFSVQSVEKYQGMTFEQQLESHKLRAKEDFFGETVESPNELE